MTEVEAKELLIDEDTFLTCGVHIGTKQKSKDMEPYVYKVRDDGLRILNVNMTSEKVVEAAMKWLARDIWIHLDNTQGRPFTWSYANRCMNYYYPQWKRVVIIHTSICI